MCDHMRRVIVISEEWDRSLNYQCCDCKEVWNEANG